MIEASSRKGSYIYINEAAAESTFRNFLQKNLKLDASLRPLSGSVAAGQVDIVEFAVFNPGDLPATDSLGNTLDEVAVHY